MLVKRDQQNRRQIVFRPLDSVFHSEQAFRLLELNFRAP